MQKKERENLPIFCSSIARSSEPPMLDLLMCFSTSSLSAPSVLLLGLVFAYLYWICTRRFDFFAKQGIPHDKPSFPFGSSNAKETLMGRESFWRTDVALAESERFKGEKVFGYFMMGQPTTIINDEELGKRILIKDFEHFTDLR